MKGYSSAVQFLLVISALKAEIIWGDFVHLLSFVKCAKKYLPPEWRERWVFSEL